MTGRDPGDFGRRVAERRDELGLSREEVARQAGIDPGYLEYLEERPGASPEVSTRLRLARALSTSVERLEGGGFGEPVGTGQPPGGVAEVLELDRTECYEMLRFRTGDGSIRGAVDADGLIGLEADRLDDALGEGWSVLATGHGALVEDAEVLQQIDALEIQSWAGEHRPRVVRLHLDEITGRRIRRHLEA